ncbi:hypothetical protein [Sporolactobacillus spathodeae]|uniref:Uncharacterized protein n=1 Tax=Sporolactobacillus spathodeae TaxID=1465502 RepID=A0ABS2Q5T6_9BACL|nr:hypothetical protein [Sporolactobacillus spathodeae]MBM7657152.1 hypothetical protein [Sporolactobacillus spathodeae]
MNQTREVVLQNEWNKVIASSFSFIGVLFFLVSAIISLSATYKSYVLATENISV